MKIKGLASILLSAFKVNASKNKTVRAGIPLSRDGRVIDRQRTPEQKREDQEAIYIANCLKKFDYPEGYVYALNKKNADKKAKKLGLI